MNRKALVHKALSGLALATIATVALAGCSTTPGNDAEGGDGEGQTLSISWNSVEKPGVEAVVAAFKKENPGVEVNVTFTSDATLQSTQRTQLQAGTIADIFYTWPGNGNSGSIQQLAPSGALYDLSDRPWADDFPAGVAPYTQVDGKTYMLSPYVGAFGIVWNQQTLDELGATVPGTYSELLALCDTAAAAGKTALALGAQTSWTEQNQPYTSVPTLVFSQEPDFNARLIAGEATFAGSDGYTRAFEQYTEMQDAGCYNADPVGTSLEQSLAAVADGTAAGVVQITSLMNAISASNPDADLVFSVFPATDNPDDFYLSAGPTAGPSVYAKSKNLELALKFIDFLAELEQLNTFAESVGAVVPSIPNDSFSLDDPNLALINEYLSAGRTSAYLDQDWPNAEVQQVMYAGLQNLIAGRETATQVLEAMDAALTK
jgi:raffinose/stachyose/melibiose transport system substrate-binding protein